MCGIAGIFHMRDTSPVSLGTVERMVDELLHRGPDARGARTYGGVAGEGTGGGTGLGHARLSILDLRAEANQPFESEDGELAITYNGEIFNYVELRRELEQLGRHFRTSSDTEVLLQAYAEWGDLAVERLNGMWAFAILDRRRDRLFCSRDRFGIKPFAYAVTGGRLLFASEIKALLAAEPALATPSWTALSMLVQSTRGYRLEQSCFEGVLRLPPAHNLIATRGGIELQRYWDYPAGTDEVIPIEEAAEQLRELLTDSIRLRMRSDVPVGSMLSSGIDSSSIVCLLRSFDSSPHATFSAAYPEAAVNEAPRAEALARELGMEPNAVPGLPEDFLGTLSRCVEHLEGPHRSPAVLPVWNIMQAASQSVTCLLDGQGADELLAGYPEACFPFACWDLVRRGRFVAAAREARLQAVSLGAPTALAWLGRTALPSSQRLLTAARGDARVLAGPLAAAPPGPTDRADPVPPQSDALNAELRRQHEGNLAHLLHYGDALSMAHGVESRLPFMDYRLVEAVFRMPGHYKLRDGLGKAVLRKAMRGTVPDDILDERRKRAFTTPIARWFRDEPEKTLHPVLLSDRCRKRGLLARGPLEEALERHRSGRFDLSFHIFRWLTMELWFQRFIDAP
jgi:asparagine synthase (glutamine-hydrolysing)